MVPATRKQKNLYWSWRYYCTTQLPEDTVIFYNPQTFPKPDAPINQWLIFRIGSYKTETFIKPQIFIGCVSREDQDGSKLMDLVDIVSNILEDPALSIKYFDLRDIDLDSVIGQIEILRYQLLDNIEEDDGIVMKPIIVDTRVKTQRNIKI